MSRTTARAAAMQMIFERVSGGQGGEETLRMVYDELRETGVTGVERVGAGEPNEADRAYIQEAFDGVLEHLEEIDALVKKHARGWAIDRIALVDLTILRLAIWEILYAKDVPGSVAISEALQMTERYTDPEDKGFVNGILGTVLREKERAE